MSVKTNYERLQNNQRTMIPALVTVLSSQGDASSDKDSICIAVFFVLVDVVKIRAMETEVVHLYVRLKREQKMEIRRGITR